MKSKTSPQTGAALPSSLGSSAFVSKNLPGTVLSLGVALCGAAASVFAQTYTLTQINPPAGASSSTVESVNNEGQVVGNTKVKNGRSDVPGRAFVWAQGVAASLPSLGSDTAAAAVAISDSGLIIGHSPRQNVYSQPPRAVWWQSTVGGSYTIGDWNSLLPAGSQLFLADAVAISPDGQFVVFDAQDKSTGLWHAAVAEANTGGITPITIGTAGTPAAPVFESLASSIQHDETVVRVVGYYARTSNDEAHAFLWQMDLASGEVTMTDLDSQPRYSFATGVNGWSEVVGNIDVGGVFQAYFWNAAGEKQQLPTLGGARSHGASINDAGYVTGWSSRGGRNATAHAFLWHVSGGIRDLNLLKASSDTSGIELTSGKKVNDKGQILANGLRKGASVNVLLEPVP